MSSTNLTGAFAQYGATLRNPQWSVSAWTPGGVLVVSLWDHHYRKGPDSSMEFTDSFARWSGPGNSEFRQNVIRAYAEKSEVRLVVTKTTEIDRVQRGDDASKIKKTFTVRDEMIGEVVELAGDNYVFRFRYAKSTLASPRKVEL